jgi:cysteine desulfurase
MKIYLDNAATTPVSRTVFDHMSICYLKDFGNPSSPHEFGKVAEQKIIESRSIVADSLNALKTEIIFTGSGTEANNMIIKGAVKYLGVTRIITSKMEHHCGLNSTKRMGREMNVDVCYLNLDPWGRINYEELEQLLKDTSKITLVSLMHSNNEIGTLLDLETTGNLCSKYKAYFHTDTVQTIGYYRIDVKKLKINFLSGSAHKFHGPKGVGFAFINENSKIGPFIDGGNQESKLRAGTENVAGIVGLGVALKIAIKDLDKIRNHFLKIKNYFIEELTANFPEIKFNGDITNEGSNPKVLSVSFPNESKYDFVLNCLNNEGVACSGKSACNTDEDSHVLLAIGADKKRKTIRFSFNKDNRESDIDSVVEILANIEKYNKKYGYVI